MRSDLNNAFRGLLAAPATTATAWVMLTLAIAAATVTFSVVDHVAMRRLPFPQDDRLVAMSMVGVRSPIPGPVAPQDYYTWEAEAKSLQAIGAIAPWGPQTLLVDNAPVPLSTRRATASLFGVLRVAPAMGTGFTADHERPGGPLVVILSDGVWRRHFGADASVIGRPIKLGKESRTVIGVMPPGFTYPIGPAKPTDLWFPFIPRPNERDHASGGRSYMLSVVGRLRDDASFEHASAEIGQIAGRVATQYPSYWRDVHIEVSPLHDLVVGPAKGWMLLVLGAVCLVMLVACANVANLLLARSMVRAREQAVRSALGASSARLFRTALLENLMLSVAGSVAGVVVAIWGVEVVAAVLPAGLPRAAGIALDARVLMAAVGATILTALVSGLVPALQSSRTDLVSVLRGTSRSATASRTHARWRAGFVVAEVAMVVAMIFATALFVTSFRRVVSTDMGFDYRGRVAFTIPTRSLAGTPEKELPARTQALFEDVLDRVGRLPHVRNAAIVDGGFPLTGGMVSYNVTATGQTKLVDNMVRAVTPDYAPTVGLRIKQGRFLSDADSAGAPRAVVLNQASAMQLFGTDAAVGRTVNWFGKDQPWTVVGVIESVKPRGPESAVRPELFVSMAQGLVTFGSFGVPTVVVDAGEQADQVTPSVIAALAPLQGAGTTPQEPQFLETHFRRLTADRRFSAGLMTVFGALALLIGAMGIYGVMAFIVNERTRDIGVRMALGASRGSIVGAVMRQAGIYMAVGLAIGLAAAAAASSVLSSVLFDVKPTELPVYAAVTVVVVCTGLVAALLPAARASRVDPLTALRAE
jgi:putative ABC transport system permease protein